MPIQPSQCNDFIKNINEQHGYLNSYRAVQCKGITKLSEEEETLLHLMGEDGASMKVDFENYSFFLQVFRIFIN